MLRRKITRLPVLVLLATLVPASLALLTPVVALAGYDTIVCAPPTNPAFPYDGYSSVAPPGCDSRFSWGYTVSGPASGTARWGGPRRGIFPLLCRASAWIPDYASNDPNADYYFFDGNRYLAHAFVDQGPYSNVWVPISDWFTIYDHLVVTLNDSNPMGQAGWYIAADAVDFECYVPPP